MSFSYEIEVSATVKAADDNQTTRRLLFEFGQNGANGSKSNNFTLQVTDSDDPLFLFDYQLTPGDYPSLKEEQQLHCEFPDFSQSFSDLLNSCVQDKDYNCVIDEKNSSQIKLLLQQNTRHCTLTHLSLVLIPATEVRLNHFLASQVRKYRNEFVNRSRTCRGLEERLKEAEESRESLTSEYNSKIEELIRESDDDKRRLSDELSTKMMTIKMKLEDEIHSLEEAKNRSETDLRQRFESQIGDLREQLAATNEEKHSFITQARCYEEKIKILEDKVEDLTLANQRLLSEKKDVDSELLRTTSELSAARAEKDQLYNKCILLDQTFQQNKETLTSNASTIESLRQDLLRKEEEVASLRDLSDRTDEKAKERDWIVAKSKEVIEKFMKENKELKAKNEQRKREMREIQERLQRNEIDMASLIEKKKASDGEMARILVDVDNLRNQINSLNDEKRVLEQRIKDLCTENAHLNHNITTLELQRANDEMTPLSIPGLSASLQPICEGGGSVFDNPTFF